MIKPVFPGFPNSMILACNNIGHINPDSEYPSYICETCFCVYGSVSMPKSCREKLDESNN